MARAFYNEIDTATGRHLQGLIGAGLISGGVVDTRSIVEVSEDDARGFDRAHFFAGVAGWELVLQLAGWPDWIPVWTGSCPCQPWSGSGKKLGAADERHLLARVAPTHPCEPPSSRLWRASCDRTWTGVDGRRTCSNGRRRLCSRGCRSVRGERRCAPQEAKVLVRRRPDGRLQRSATRTARVPLRCPERLADPEVLA